MAQTFNIANNRLTAAIYHEFNNSVFSPTSIAYALSMVHMGTGGDTRTELGALLGLKTEQTIGIEQLKYILSIVDMSNVMYVDKRLHVKDQFVKAIAEISKIKPIDFSNKNAAADEINAHVKQQTKGLIKKIVDPASLSSLVRLMLINTIYFKNNWLRPFGRHSTSKSRFETLSRSGPIEIDMMYQKNKFRYCEDNTAQFIEMSYADERYCMGVLLPKQLVKPQAINLSRYINNAYEDTVKVYFPKFTQRHRFTLNNFMKKYGVKKLFTDGEADIKKIAENIFVSDVIHEAVVIVDEQGTEAAAATSVTMCVFNCSGPPIDYKVFKADHPFTYFIRYRPTDTILFIGNYYGN